ncbi:beta-N-acetylhexosaminidase [Kutzneria albida]|uniref:beta-N-acetylhexosaminidase n=1 Tax=Kutzneria albida DSM 43870 TaxID=1449976 RepID=W5VYD6_9PSEU|nr:beta-N-acetylhexosaminidase [Kutzneria albida]AHH93908.1 beta-N-acetylhexosaminidase [Kutzneria albida DSM 43870]
MSGFDVLLPKPSSVDEHPGVFVLGRSATLGGDAQAVSWLREVLGAATGFALAPSTTPDIAVNVVSTVDGYQISVSPESVVVTAGDEASAFHAAQTLRQLLGPQAFRAANVHSGQWEIPCGIVTDRPRFGWRGCLLDVARHFMPKDGLLRFIDLLAAHKLNVLHLHLTDDQGWRFEVKRYPRLTEVGAWRAGSRVGAHRDNVHDGRPHGGFYTQDDLREVVAYAARRHITVVPEIDIPGHSQAAIAAYPELGNLGTELPVWPLWGINENVLNTKESTVDFFRDVFDELVEVFPSEVICLGGDEVPTVQWTEERAEELGVQGVAGLHGWFIRQIADHLAKRGRRAMGWDEITEVGPLPDGVIVTSWRGEEAGIAAAQAGYEVVMCPEQKVYLDHRESDREDEPIPVGEVHTTADVYEYEPVPAELTGGATARVLGAQAQVWTEHLDSPRRVDYAAFPRLAAFAEVVWSSRAGKDTDEFLRRLAEHHLPRLDALGVEYRPLAGPHPWQTRPGVPGRPR